MLKSSKRSLRNSAGSDRPKTGIPATLGGSGSILPSISLPPASAGNQVRARLGLLPNTYTGIYIAPLDQNKLIPAGMFEEVDISGPTTMKVGVPATFTITNYDSRSTYELSVYNGGPLTGWMYSAVDTNGQFTLQVTNASGYGIVMLSVNSSIYSVNLVANTPDVPTITSPTTGAVDRPSTVTITSSTFSPTDGSITQVSSDWQLATDQNFINIAQQVADSTTALTSWTTSTLSVSTTYYARVRYKASNGAYSDWSPAISFTTRAFWGASIPQGMLLPADVIDYDHFGDSCAVNADGTYAVISAPLQQGNGVAGAAYVYIRTETTWTLQAKLIPSAVISAAIGATLALAINDAGDGIAVGYKGCYIAYYRRTGTNWVQTDTITPPQDSTIFFATSISIDSTGNTLTVSDPVFKIVSFQNGPGIVYVYNYTNAAWSLTAALQQPDGVAGDGFGWCVSINGAGTVIAIGAPWNGTGYCSIFTLSNSTWAFKQKLTPSDTSTPQQFGTYCQIAVGGYRLIIGADRYNKDKGRAYYFRSDDDLNSWNQQWVFDAPADTISGDGFGGKTVIATGGAYIAISRTSNLGSEAVFIYSRSVANDGITESFTLQKKLDDPSGATGTQFGWGLGISRDGNYFIIGANYDHDERGIAYIFA